MLISDKKAIEEVLSAKDTYLEVTSEGLRAERKNWLGRIWMWLGMSNASMEKVLEYLQKHPIHSTEMESEKYEKLKSKVEHWLAGRSNILEYLHLRKKNETHVKHRIALYFFNDRNRIQAPSENLTKIAEVPSQAGGSTRASTVLPNSSSSQTTPFEVQKNPIKRIEDRYISHLSEGNQYISSFESYKNEQRCDPEFLEFLANEIRNIQESLQQVLAELSEVEQYNDAVSLKEKIEGSKTKFEQKIGEIEGKRVIDSTTSLVRHQPIGIMNMGNSCYMNAALQMLMSIPSFSDMLPDSISLEKGKEKEAQAKKEVTALLKKIIQCDASASQLFAERGKLVAQLRLKIYESGLMRDFSSARNSLTTMLDSGDFLTLILELMNYSLMQETTCTYTGRIATSSDSASSQSQGILDNSKADNSEHLESSLEEKRITRKEKNPITNFLLKGSGSLQEMIDTEARIQNEFFTPGNEPTIDGDLSPNGEAERVFCTKKEEFFRFLGEPPEIIFLQGPTNFETMQATYIVDANRDSMINLGLMFGKEKNDLNYQYELIGFCQNLGQYHWVSVVKRAGGWFLCNDSTVTPIQSDSSSFLRPAGYFLYKKKSKPTQ